MICVHKGNRREKNTKRNNTPPQNVRTAVAENIGPFTAEGPN
jgi:hypothetical protein